MPALTAEDKKRYAIFGVAVLITLALDQASKWAIMEYLPQGKSIPVIAGFFDLVHIRNRGAAFGFLNRHDIEWQFWLFLLATIIALWAVWSLLRGARGKMALCLGLGLITGGALGNLLDRLRFRSVVDFLDFYLGSWHWPAFNVADMGICCGAFLACLSLWKRGNGGAK